MFTLRDVVFLSFLGFLFGYAVRVLTHICNKRG